MGRSERRREMRLKSGMAGRRRRYPARKGANRPKHQCMSAGTRASSDTSQCCIRLADRRRTRRSVRYFEVVLRCIKCVSREEGKTIMISTLALTSAMHAVDPSCALAILLPFSPSHRLCQLVQPSCLVKPLLPKGTSRAPATQRSQRPSPARPMVHPQLLPRRLQRRMSRSPSGRPAASPTRRCTTRSRTTSRLPSP